MSTKLEVVAVGLAIALAGLAFFVASTPIARWYNGAYSRLPGHLHFAVGWPKVFGAFLFVFGALFIGLGAGAVR